MIIDDQIVTPRADPAAEPIINNDLRPAKEMLIDICAKLEERQSLIKHLPVLSGGA